jgi:hypothetical protein
MTVKKAGETYLRLSAASNAAREAWMRAPRPTLANLAEYKRLAARAAKATVAFSQSRVQPRVKSCAGRRCTVSPYAAGRRPER